MPSWEQDGILYRGQGQVHLCTSWHTRRIGRWHYCMVLYCIETFMRSCNQWLWKVDDNSKPDKITRSNPTTGSSEACHHSTLEMLRESAWQQRMDKGCEQLQASDNVVTEKDSTLRRNRRDVFWTAEDHRLSHICQMIFLCPLLNQSTMTPQSSLVGSPMHPHWANHCLTPHIWNHRATKQCST